MIYRLKINGTQVANPIEGGIKVVDEPIWADGAGRNVSTGEMIATLVTWKRQIEITWNNLTVAQARTILLAIKSGGSFFNIEYNDVDEDLYTDTGGEYVKIRVYVANIPRTISTLSVLNDSSKKRIKDVTIVFTEK